MIMGKIHWKECGECKSIGVCQMKPTDCACQFWEWNEVTEEAEDAEEE